MLKKPARFHLVHLRGFTLVELLVSIAILAVLIAGVFISINPRAQIDKARDAVRKQDIEEIKKGLEVYYSDKGCYPKSTGTEFATALTEGGQWGDEGTNTVYIKKVPKDPDGTPYTYLTDSVACPQWNVLFAKLTKPSTTTQACSLTSNNSCTPQGFDSSWACAVSGSTAANCSTIQAFVIATPTAVPTVGVPTNTPTPTPTPAVGNFTVAMNSDPWFVGGTIYPYPAGKGSQQFTIDAKGTNPVKSVSVEVTINKKKGVNYKLKLASGTETSGTWSGTWNVADTKISTYTIDITATDSVGTSSTFSLIYK